MKNANEQLDELIDASLEFALTGDSLALLASRVASDATACDRFESAMQSQRIIMTGSQSLSEIAAGVTLPTDAPASFGAANAARVQTFFRRALPIAAVLVFSVASWMISGNLASRPGQVNTEVTPVASTAQSAFANYMQVGLDEGRILRELPPVTVEIETTESGTEVVYVRRLLERAHVDDLYRVGQDESGRPVAVPVNLTALTPGQSL